MGRAAVAGRLVRHLRYWRRGARSWSDHGGCRAFRPLPRRAGAAAGGLPAVERWDGPPGAGGRPRGARPPARGPAPARRPRGGARGAAAARGGSCRASGGRAEQLAGPQAGGVDAAVLSPPTNLRGRQLGFFELLSYRDFAFEFAGMGRNTTRRYLKEQPETLDRLLRALAEG